MADLPDWATPAGPVPDSAPEPDVTPPVQAKALPDWATPAPEAAVPTQVAQTKQTLPDWATPAPAEAYQPTVTPFIKEQTVEAKDKLAKVITWAGEKWDALPNAAQTAVKVASWPARKAFGAMQYSVDLASRVAGTSIVGATYYSKYLGFDPLDSEQIRAQADADDIKYGTNVDTATGERKTRYFNISLGQDLIQKPLERDLIKYGQELQKSPSKAANITGDILEGTAPAIALAGAVVGESYLNPLSMVRFGQLTEQGLALAKEDALVGNTAQQLARGDRSLLSLRLGDKAGVGGLGVDIESRTIAPQVLSKVQEGLIKVEQSKAGQGLRYITTLSGWDSADEGVRSLVTAEKMSASRTRKVMLKAESILAQDGVDTNNPELMKSLYKYMDQPSTHVDESLISRQTVQNVTQALDDELALRYKIAEAQGIPAPQFKPGTGLQDSERYVPRGTTISKAQELKLKEEFGPLLDLPKLGEEARALGNAPKGGGMVDSGFLKNRSKLTKDAINAEIEKNFGIKDYYHSDPILAYAQKIEQVSKATNQKALVDQIATKFPETRAEWLLAKSAANSQIGVLRGAGEIPATDLLRTANVSVNGVRPLSQKAINAISRLNPFAEVGEAFPVTRSLIPGPVADLIESTFVRPDPGFSGAAAGAFTKYFKANVTFSPGFHLRNWYRSFTRANAADVEMSDIAKSMKVLWTDKATPAEKALAEEFHSFGDVHGMLTETNVAGETFSGKDIQSNLMKMREGVKIQISQEMLKSENGFSRFLNGLQHQAATGSFDKLWGKTKEFISPTDNPLYKFSRTVNVAGEDVFRFSLYQKLRNEGYTAEAALGRVNNTFMNYDIVRGTVASPMAKVIAPFMNHAIKNAETLGTMLLQKPATYAKYGPGGYLERAIGQWGGWDPYIVPKLQDELPGYLADHMGSILIPGGPNILKEKDFVKQLMGRWYGSPEDLELLVKLPSNYHDARMVNPFYMDELQGPLVKAGIAAMGVDPFTGEPIKLANNPDVGASEKLKAAMAEVAQGVNPWPSNLISAGQAEIERLFPDWEKNFINRGYDDRTAEFIFGKKYLDSDRNRMESRLNKIKSFYMGSASTKLGADLNTRQIVYVKQMRDEQKFWVDKRKKGEITPDKMQAEMDRISDRYDKKMDDLDAVRDEFDRRYDKARGNNPDPKFVPMDLNTVPKDTTDDFDDTTPEENAEDATKAKNLIDGTHDAAQDPGE